MWYVLGSLKRNQELKIRDELRRASYECYVPLRYAVKTVKGVKKRLMLPAISGLIFIKGSLEDLQEKIKFNKNTLYLRKSTFSNKEDYLTIPDAVMQNFIAVASKADENITYFTPDETAYYMSGLSMFSSKKIPVKIIENDLTYVVTSMSAN